MATTRQRKRKQRQRRHHAGQQLVVPLFEHLTDIAEGRRPLPESSANYQHYVPQLHLRGFSRNPRPAKNARIWLLDKESGVIEEKRVARVAGEKRFYRAKGPDDRYWNAVEAWLGIVEHYAAPALERLVVTGERPSSADRLTISFYLGMQSTRTPYGLQAIKQTTGVVLDTHVALWTHQEKMFADICRNAGIDESSEVIEDLRQRMREPGYVRMSDPRTEALRGAVTVAGDLTNTIAPMTWTLLRSDEPLVVGDHPITHHHATPPRFPWTEPAWRSSPTAESFIPLTSNLVLKMSHPQDRREDEFCLGELTSADVAELNRRSYGWATRYVFAEEESTLARVQEDAAANLSAVPRASRQHQVFTADERAFRSWEPNEQPPGWPTHVPRRGQNGELERCRYKVVRNDRPEELRAATEWMLRAEQRLHPGSTPSLEMGSRDDIAPLVS